MTILAPAIFAAGFAIALYAIGQAARQYPRILHALGGSDHTETRL